MHREYLITKVRILTYHRRIVWLHQCSNLGMDCRETDSKRIPAMAGLWPANVAAEGTLGKRRRWLGLSECDILYNANRYVCSQFCP